MTTSYSDDWAKSRLGIQAKRLVMTLNDLWVTFDEPKNSSIVS